MGQVGRHQHRQLQRDHHTAGREEPRWQLDHRALLRIHRDLRRRDVHAELCRRHCRQDESQTHAPRAPERPARSPARIGMGLHERGRDGDQARGRRQLRRQLHRQRHLRVQLYGQGPDCQRPRLRRGARLECVAALRREGRLRHRQSAGRRRAAHLYRDLVAAGPLPQRLHPPRLQPSRERQEGVRRNDAVDQRRQRAESELPLLAAQPHRAQSPGPSVRREPLPVRQRRDDRSVHRQDRQPLRALRTDRDLPARGRNLFGQRVLGQDGVAAAHHTGRPARPGRLAVCAQLFRLEPPARHRRHSGPRQLPATDEPAEFGADPARHVPRAR